MNHADFDRLYEERRRSIRRSILLINAVAVVLCIALALAVAGALLHPEAIGHWIGRLVSAARVA